MIKKEKERGFSRSKQTRVIGWGWRTGHVEEKRRRFKKCEKSTQKARLIAVSLARDSIHSKIAAGWKGIRSTKNARDLL